MLTAVLHQHGAQQFWGLLLKHLNISGFRMQVIALVSIYKTFFWPKAHLCRERRDLHTGALKQSEGILAAQHPLPLRAPLMCPKQTQLLLKEDQASPDLMHCLPAATAAEQGCKGHKEESSTGDGQRRACSVNTAAAPYWTEGHKSIPAVPMRKETVPHSLALQHAVYPPPFADMLSGCIGSTGRFPFLLIFPSLSLVLIPFHVVFWTFTISSYLLSTKLDNVVPVASIPFTSLEQIIRQ